ncbi:MAG: radical SAM protein [archaeon]
MKKIPSKHVVFVNPPISQDEQCEEFSPIAGFDIPFGLCYLAATARKEGYAVSIIDAPALRYSSEKTINEILSQAPDYICITSTTYSIMSAISLSKQLKRRTGAKRIFGGPHCSALPREAAPYFDACVIGEGEITLVDLLGSFDRKKSLRNVPGIAFQENGKVITTAPRPFISNLDMLPMPAFDLIPNIINNYHVVVQEVLKYPSVGLISSRGCTGRCGFCARCVFGNKISFHGAKYLHKMISYFVKEYHVRGIMFRDDNFMLFKRRNIELMRLLRKDGIRIKFSCLGRADSINDNEYLWALKKGGLWCISLGIESGSQKILDFYKKDITLEQVGKAIHLIRDAGLRLKGLFIIGSPLETKETLEKTRQFIMSHDMTDIGLSYFTPLPGSDIYDDVKKYGKVIGNYDEFSMYRIVFIPRGLKKEDIEYYYNRIYKEFYLRPRIILDYVRRIRSIGQLIYLAKGLRVFMTEVLTRSTRKAKIKKGKLRREILPARKDKH